jgi:hypothetical protein
MASRKRLADTQLNKDSALADDDSEEQCRSADTRPAGGTNSTQWNAAPTLAGRRIVRVRRTGAQALPSSEQNAGRNSAGPATQGLSSESTTRKLPVAQASSEAARSVEKSPASTRESTLTAAPVSTQEANRLSGGAPGEQGASTARPLGSEAALVHNSSGEDGAAPKHPASGDAVEKRAAGTASPLPPDNVSAAVPKAAPQALPAQTAEKRARSVSAGVGSTETGSAANSETISSGAVASKAAALTADAPSSAGDSEAGQRSNKEKQADDVPKHDAEKNQPLSGAAKVFAGFTFGNLSTSRSEKMTGLASFRFQDATTPALQNNASALPGSTPLFPELAGGAASKGTPSRVKVPGRALESTDGRHCGEHDAYVEASEGDHKSAHETGHDDDDDGGGDGDNDDDANASEAMPSTVPDIFNNESEEEMRLQTRAKLFELVDKQWRERGRGLLRLLYHPSKQTARMVMRVDGTLRVILNVPITRETPRLDEAGEAMVRFVATQNASEEAADATASTAPSGTASGTVTDAPAPNAQRRAQVWCLRFAHREDRIRFGEMCATLQRVIGQKEQEA